MIKAVEVKYFRNIQHAYWEFNSSKVLLTGCNGIGKSNALNALMWLLSGTLLTDNYGVGENDIVSIIPRDYQKGQHTEVSVWTDMGTKFTKRYKCTYQRGTNRINGHTTELLINDVLQNKISDFEEELWKAFDYIPTFKTKDIKELNLFTDPLYALQKLDADKLRKLLVAIGCSVKNEEVEGYEELATISSKYLGDLDKAAADYKKQALAHEKEIKIIETKLETVSEIEFFNPSTLQELNEKKSRLIGDKTRLKDSNVNPKIQEIESEIQKLKLEKRSEFERVNSEITLEIKRLNQSISLEKNKINEYKENKLTKVKADISLLEHEVKSNEEQVAIYNKYISKYDKEINYFIEEAKKGRQAKNDYAVKLVAVQGSHYNNYITCPHCNESFVASEIDKQRFEEDRTSRLNSIKKSIQELQLKDVGLKDKVVKVTEERDAAKHEVHVLTERIKALKEKLGLCINEKVRIENEPVDTSVMDSLYAELANAKRREAEHISTQYCVIPELEELQMKKQELIDNSEETIKLQIRTIDDDLLDIEDKLSLEYVKRSKWAEKEQYKGNLKTNQKKWNEVESIRGKIITFIQKRIQLLNERAYKKTGIKFIMAEANLGDGTIKEQTVCYATVDGVPFKDVNTAKKIEVGIQFINTLKQIAFNDFGNAINQFPILVDRLECFDSLIKIKSLDTQQLIGTRVTDNGNRIEMMELC